MTSQARQGSCRWARSGGIAPLLLLFLQLSQVGQQVVADVIEPVGQRLGREVDFGLCDKRVDDAAGECADDLLDRAVHFSHQVLLLGHDLGNLLAHRFLATLEVGFFRLAEPLEILRSHGLPVLERNDVKCTALLPLDLQVQILGLIEELVIKHLAALAEGCPEAIAFGGEILGLEGLGQVVPQAVEDLAGRGAEPGAVAGGKTESHRAIGLVEIVDVHPVVRSRLTPGSLLEQLPDQLHGVRSADPGREHVVTALRQRQPDLHGPQRRVPGRSPR